MMRRHVEDAEMVEVTDEAGRDVDIRTFRDSRDDQWVLIRASYFVYLLSVAHRHEPRRHPSDTQAAPKQHPSGQGPRGTRTVGYPARRGTREVPHGVD